MKKSNHKTTCYNFAIKMGDLKCFYLDTQSELPPIKGNVQWHHALTETVFHRAYVSFEIFMSDLFVDLINRDSRVFLQTFSDSIKQSIGAKFNQAHQSRLSYKIEKHLRIQTIEELADGEGKNISFSDSDGLQKRARTWLAPEFANKFTAIPSDRWLIVDAAKSIRNCIAHGSTKSLKEANQAIQGLPDLGICKELRRKNREVRSIGAYLQAIRKGKSRCELYIDELTQIAGDLI